MARNRGRSARATKAIYSHFLNKHGDRVYKEKYGVNIIFAYTKTSLLPAPVANSEAWLVNSGKQTEAITWYDNHTRPLTTSFSELNLVLLLLSWHFYFKWWMQSSFQPVGFWSTYLIIMILDRCFFFVQIENPGWKRLIASILTTKIKRERAIYIKWRPFT